MAILSVMNTNLKRGDLVNAEGGVMGVVLDRRVDAKGRTLNYVIVTRASKGETITRGWRIPLTTGQLHALKFYADREIHSFDGTVARNINALVTLGLLRYVSGSQAEVTGFGIVTIAAKWGI